MPASAKSSPLDLKRSVLETFAVNEKANQPLLENLDDAAWQADAPSSKGRHISGIAEELRF